MNSMRLKAKQGVNFESLISLVISFALLLALANLVACGKLQTDPAADYPELKNFGPPHNEKPHEQSYIESAIYQLEAEQELDFVQGKSSSYLFTPRLLINGVAYELEAKNLPEGARFARSTEPGEEGKYRLTYTPPFGTLSDQELKRPFRFQVELKVTGTADAAAADVLNTIYREREFGARILRSDEQPVVEKVELPLQEISAGESLAFKVIVKDLGAGEKAPRLSAFNEMGASNESAKLDAASLVRINPNPEVLGKGRFRFSVKIDTKGVELPGSSALVPARFVLVINSRAGGLPAVDQLVEIRVKRNVAPPPVKTQAPSNSSPATNQGDKK
jgi:hypothetical protein